MKVNQPFSLYARCKSFVYAFAGIKVFLKNEHNALLHLAGTIIVLFLALFFKVSSVEAALLLFVAGLVWITELLNTAIEKIMDFISTQQHPKIKFIKDIAAAAVLVAAIVAFITGCIVFIPKF